MKYINRRTFLRGTGVALALPLLDIMGPRFAQASAPTRRMVNICCTLGLYRDSWMPTTAGRNYEASEYLSIIDRHREKYTVFSGLSHEEQTGRQAHNSEITWLTSARHPGMDGFQVLRKIRENLSIPVIMLTARGEVTDRIVGLELGADDYLPKPFEPKELLLRIKNLLQKNKSIGIQSNIIKFGPYSFNLKKEILKKNGKIFFLTSSELKLLRILAKNDGKPIIRYELAKVLNIPNESRALDVQITRLRNKIESNKKFPTYIQTVRGKGYVLKIE